ncbi:hypothetical protein [Pseudonocardia sp. NPDC049635]|uniref:hypothetical protein n=1 Tax=Pseudonocardia sp. NPDC049635 TaxID=3155506 RepID=UPI0033C9F5F1
MTSASVLLGAPAPRVELRPADVIGSYGPEACELAELAGLPLEDWQADALDVMLSFRADAKWAAREYAELVGRQQGKSAGVGLPRALAGLLLLGERLIMWSAHEVKTALESFLALRLAFEQLGEPAGNNLIALDDGALLVKVINNNGYEGFELSTGQRMRFVARSKGSGRGFSGDVNLIDEAFAYTRQQQSALAPTQLARPNPQTVYLSSPPLRGDVEEGKVLFALAARAAKGHAGGETELGFRDWGLATSLDDVAAMAKADRAAFLDDRDNWCAALPALGRGRVTEASILTLRREMDELDFAREVLGCWPVQLSLDGRWQVIRESAWRARGDGDRDAWSDSVAFAVSMPPEQDWAAIDVAGPSLDGDEILLQVADYERGTAWVLPRILELAARHPDAVTAIDPRGPAGYLIPHLERAGVEIVTPSVLEVAHAAQRFVRGVVDEPVIRHFDQEALDIAVKAAVKRPMGDGWTWMRRGGTDISPVDAGSLAVWAAEDAAGPVSAPLAVPANTGNDYGDGLGALGGDLAHVGF